ncbi:MAG: UDP binding domain-containing protein, partial [Bdellovibrio sp.]
TKLQVYDPAASENTSAQFNSPHLHFAQTPYACLEGASALVIATEWKAFRDPDFQRMKSLMKIPQIFDGRNIYNVSLLREQGFLYESIGRRSSLDTRKV